MTDNNEQQETSLNQAMEHLKGQMKDPKNTTEPSATQQSKPIMSELDRIHGQDDQAMTMTSSFQQTTDSDFLPEPTPAKEEDKPTPDPVVIVRVPQNVYLDAPITGPTDVEDPVVKFPSDTDKRTSQILGNMPNVNIGGTKQGDLWARTVQGSLGMTAYEDTFQSTLEDPKADFHQTLEANGTRFGSHEARFKERQNSIFDGEMAVLRAISHLGLGSTWNAALYNTGVWVTFKPPSEEDLVELYRQLTSDQIEMGRMSYGLVYANTTSFIIERICRFAVQHIYRIGANPEEIAAGNILSLIKAQDISSLLWGFACTMFPKGFAYSRACTANPEKCQHVVNETINLRKLQVVNRQALTERQKTHMAENRGQTKMSVKDLQLYEADMVRAASYRIVVHEGEKNEIIFNLRSPSILEHIEAGHRWIDDMTNIVEQTLGATASPDEKNKLIELKSRATLMRQYCHWVDSIEIDSNQIKDRASVEKVLNNISSDQIIRETFLAEVKKFIENSSVTVIGIPTFDCPACGKGNEGPLTYPHRTSMIPIDVVQLFFVLLTQKIRDLSNR